MLFFNVNQRLQGPLYVNRDESTPRGYWYVEAEIVLPAPPANATRNHKLRFNRARRHYREQATKAGLMLFAVENITRFPAYVLECEYIRRDAPAAPFRGPATGLLRPSMSHLVFRRPAFNRFYSPRTLTMRSYAFDQAKAIAAAMEIKMHFSDAQPKVARYRG